MIRAMNTTLGLSDTLRIYNGNVAKIQVFITCILLGSVIFVTNANLFMYQRT